MLGAPRLLVALLWAAALLADPAAARVLDDFTRGPFVAASDPDSAEEARSEQAGLSESHVVGGVRLVAVGRGGLGRAGVALAPDEIDGVVLTGAPSAYFDFYYDGLAGGDAASGRFGALGLDLSGASAIRFRVADLEAPGAQLTLSLWDSSRLDSQEIALVEGTNTIALPFGTRDLSDIRQLKFQVWLLNGGALRLTEVVAVSAGDPPAGSGLPAPELLAPASGAIVPAEAPAFSWTPVAGASGYRLVAATDPGALPEDPGAGACAACSIDANTPLPTHVHELGLPASTAHWWRAQALPAGDWSASSVFTTSGAVALQITRPEAGASLDAASVVVRGVMTPPPGMEIGVEINGIPAFHDPNAFAAIVPIADSVELLTATARDGTGTVVGRHAIPVSVEVSDEEPVIGFSVAPDMGTAPHTAHFGFSTRKFVLTLTLDADSNGEPERVGRGAMDARTEPSYTYHEPGLYEPTLTVVTDSDTIDTPPETHTLSELVRVYSAEELDAILKPRWSALKDALRAGNVPAALEQIVIRRRSEYADVLDDLTIPPGDIDQELTEIVFDRQLGRSVEYEMHRTENGTVYSYPVVFQLDEDGIWRLEAF